MVPPTSMSYEQVEALLRAGRPHEAFHEALGHVTLPLMFFCRARCREEDAQDVVQETLLLAFRSMNRFRGRTMAELRAFLYTTAHRCILRLGLNNRLPTVEFGEIDETTIVPKQDYRTNLDEYRPFVEKVLAGYPPAWQAAFHLWLDQELTQSEIADRLGITYDQIRYRIYRITLALKEAWRKATELD